MKINSLGSIYSFVHLRAQFVRAQKEEADAGAIVEADPATAHTKSSKSPTGQDSLACPSRRSKPEVER